MRHKGAEILTGRNTCISDHIAYKTLSALLAPRVRVPMAAFGFTGAHVLVLFLNRSFFFSVQFKSFDILEDQEVSIVIFHDQNHMSCLSF